MGQHWRNPPLVTPQPKLNQGLHFCCIRVGRCSGCASRARWIANCNPRLTSVATSVKGICNTDFRGWITTSTGASTLGHEIRTASRIRRLRRLRSTAPPNALPTVNPTRSELPGSVFSAWATRRKKNKVMFPVNCRLPPSYTRWKSVCRSSRFDLGNSPSTEVTSCRSTRILDSATGKKQDG